MLLLSVAAVQAPGMPFAYTMSEGPHKGPGTEGSGVLRPRGTQMRPSGQFWDQFRGLGGPSLSGTLSQPPPLALLMRVCRASVGDSSRICLLTFTSALTSYRALDNRRRTDRDDDTVPYDQANNQQLLVSPGLL